MTEDKYLSLIQLNRKHTKLRQNGSQHWHWQNNQTLKNTKDWDKRTKNKKRLVAVWHIRYKIRKTQGSNKLSPVEIWHFNTW